MDQATARTTPILLGLFSMVTLVADHLHATGSVVVRQASWYEKSVPTFSDALAAVRRHNQIMYRAILEHVGYRVLECPDGRSAIECVQAESPDLVLMDLAMPGIDGWEVTRILKSDPRTNNIPVLALTARVMPDDRGRSRRAAVCKPGVRRSGEAEA